MNSSRMGSVSKICALLGLAAAAACSSSSGGSDGGSTSGSSGTSSTTDGSSTSGSTTSGSSGMAGTGSPCAFTTSVNLAIKSDVKVKWPSTTGVTNETGQDYYFWSLATLTIDSSNKFTGTLRTCNAQSPIITLSSVGAMSVGAASGAMAQVQIQSPVTLWDKITRTAKVTGSLGGLKGGSSINFDQAVQINGISDDSMWANASTAWPKVASSGYDFSTIMSATPTALPGDAMHYTDDDGDGKPGFTVTPNTSNGFYAPHTSTSASSPAVDKLYIAQRTVLTTSGTLDDSCMTLSGDSNFTQIDQHVIGCEIAGTTTDCSSSQWYFIDAVQTVYTAMSGTFTGKVLTGSSPTCDDVVSAVP